MKYIQSFKPKDNYFYNYQVRVAYFTLRHFHILLVRKRYNFNIIIESINNISILQLKCPVLFILKMVI